jgi:hypothetical protein
MGKKYLAYNLSDESRSEILARFPPKFQKVKCHHITYLFDVSDEEIPPRATAQVIGYSNNDYIECVVVKINDSEIRPDGKTFHITLSHDDEASASDSNVLLSEVGFTPIDPFDIIVSPAKNYR